MFGTQFLNPGFDKRNGKQKDADTKTNILENIKRSASKVWQTEKKLANTML